MGRQRTSTEWLVMDAALVANPVPYTRERGLWLAVMWRALADYCGDVQNDIRTASRWIKSDNIYVGSFVWICDTIGIDPGRLRHVLLDDYEAFYQRFRPVNFGTKK
jgi:hypothetical protein